jgi:PIN domain nuclease of toxin-antitoxin system
VESLIYLDTHVVAWLYARGGNALSAAAAEAIDGADRVLISPMVRLELQYLFEIGRLGGPALPVLDELAVTVGLEVCELEFDAVVRAAEDQAWTRDPFDRLIVAQAARRDAPLVTKDQTIHDHYPRAVW